MSSHPKEDAAERSEPEALSGLATSTCSPLLVPADKVFQWGQPCPYCGGKITAQCEGWVEEDDGTWSADMIHMDCSSEPDIDSDEWDQWCADHGDGDYCDAWHRLSERILAVMRRKFRFIMENTKADSPR